MGFTTPNLPKVDPESFLAQPLMERVKTLVLKWVDYGYGVPRMVHLIYLVKLVVFYCVLGVTLATATSGLPAFWHVAQWWDQPIVYQKLILWTVLLELLGPGRVVGAAGRQDQTDDRWVPVLGPAQHNSLAAMAAGAVHRG